MANSSADKLEKTEEKRPSVPESAESSVANTPAAEMPDPSASKISKEVLSDEDQEKAS